MMRAVLSCLLVAAGAAAGYAVAAGAVAACTAAGLPAWLAGPAAVLLMLAVAGAVAGE